MRGHERKNPEERNKADGQKNFREQLPVHEKRSHAAVMQQPSLISAARKCCNNENVKRFSGYTSIMPRSLSSGQRGSGKTFPFHAFSPARQIRPGHWGSNSRSATDRTAPSISCSPFARRLFRCRPQLTGLKEPASTAADRAHIPSKHHKPEFRKLIITRHCC